jgi:transposase-like protein
MPGLSPHARVPLVETQVLPRPQRRRFTADYKRRILNEADQCRQPGQLGALLRREGLYSSHLTTWRRQRAGGRLATPQGGREGADPARVEVARLQRENQRLQKRLAQAETIIAVQKKLCDLLGLASADSLKGDSK